MKKYIIVEYTPDIDDAWVTNLAQSGQAIMFKTENEAKDFGAEHRLFPFIVVTLTDVI